MRSGPNAIGSCLMYICIRFMPAPACCSRWAMLRPLCCSLAVLLDEDSQAGAPCLASFCLFGDLNVGCLDEVGCCPLLLLLLPLLPLPLLRCCFGLVLRTAKRLFPVSAVERPSPSRSPVGGFCSDVRSAVCSTRSVCDRRFLSCSWVEAVFSLVWAVVSVQHGAAAMTECGLIPALLNVVQLNMDGQVGRREKINISDVKGVCC